MEGWKEQVRKRAFVQSYRRQHAREDTRKGKTELRSGWAQRTLWFLKRLQYSWFLLELATGRGQSVMSSRLTGKLVGHWWSLFEMFLSRCQRYMHFCVFFNVRLYLLQLHLIDGYWNEVHTPICKWRRAWLRACSGSGNKPHILNDGCSKWKHVVSKQHTPEWKAKRGTCKCTCQASEILWC